MVVFMIEFRNKNVKTYFYKVSVLSFQHWPSTDSQYWPNTDSRYRLSTINVILRRYWQPVLAPVLTILSFIWYDKALPVTFGHAAQSRVSDFAGFCAILFLSFGFAFLGLCRRRNIAAASGRYQSFGLFDEILNLTIMMIYPFQVLRRCAAGVKNNNIVHKSFNAPCAYIFNYYRFIYIIYQFDGVYGYQISPYNDVIPVISTLSHFHEGLWIFFRKQLCQCCRSKQIHRSCMRIRPMSAFRFPTSEIKILVITRQTKNEKVLDN
ncbi:hypothetical protein QTP88_014799 [Uroleucon formosanum]